MSTDIGRKFRQIRDFLGLSRSEMGDRLDVPGRSLEGVELGRRTPGTDFLLRVVEQWPQYALWLLTDQTIPQYGQVEPTTNPKPVSELWITEIADARFLEAMETKPGALQKLIFLQSEETENALAALFYLPEEGNPSIPGVSIQRAILTRTGNINFASTHGGRLALLAMRDWLDQENPSLIRGAEFCTISTNDLESLSASGRIKSNLIKANQTHHHHERFVNWIAGKDIYQYGK